MRRTGGEHAFTEGRDHWYHDLVEEQPTECEPEPMDAEDPLYLLYTSGTTGKPKGIVHTTGGYLTQVAATHRMIFDIHEDDVYWCAADIGWVTGHSYIVYGPLANHTTGIIYEGAPDWPDKDRLVGDRRALPGHDPVHGADRDPRVHALGHASTPRSTTCRRCGCSGRSASRSIPRRGSGTGRYIGGERCPIVDTWWQTETGAILITPLPGITPLKPGSATFPFPGIQADVVDEAGNDRAAGRRRLPRAAAPVAGDRADDLGRPGPLRRDVLLASTGPSLRRRATAPSGTRTGTSGCSGASTT